MRARTPKKGGSRAAPSNKRTFKKMAQGSTSCETADEELLFRELRRGGPFERALH